MTTRMTITLSQGLLSKIKTIIKKDNNNQSVNTFINDAVELYLKKIEIDEYEKQMKAAANDPEFIERTMNCTEDFKYIDSEGLGTGEW